MKTQNRAEIIGRLGQDAEVRHSSSGKEIGNLSVATSDNYKDKDGKWVERTDWHKVVVFGALAELCKSLKKGDLISAVGKMKTRKWDKNGVTQYTHEVVVEGFDGMLHVLTDKKKVNQKVFNGNIEEEEEIPF